MPPTIMLVDDEPAVLAILRRVMAGLAGDYNVIAVTDGAAALAQFAQRPIACVVTDYQMPDMDGVALTTAIKVVAPQCPVILMTGYPTDEVQHHARVAEADCYLPKPFALAQLEAAIQTALAH